jgi:DNA-binding protein H-NS
MANINLSSMSVKELQELIKQATIEIANKEKLRIKEARAKIAEIADEYGVMLNELLKVPARVRASRAKTPPKFRNPKDPSQTWAGRGRKPAWLEAELKKGAKLEGFLIK